MGRTPSEPQETIAFRLTQILRRLNEGQRLDPQALSEEFGVNLRTIQRDLNERFAFLDLERKDGLYALHLRYLGQLSYADIEHFASLAGLQGLYPQLSTTFLKEILDSSQAQSSLVVQGPNYEEFNGKEPVFEQLKAAIEAHRVVSFDYEKVDGLKRVNSVEPYRLVNHTGIWYLNATDAGRPKSYSFAKITRLEVLSQTFLPNANIQKVLNEEDSIWLNLNKTEVILKVNPPAADYFRRRKLIGSQKLVKELVDGSLILSGLIAHPDQILPTVRAWIPSIRIISPESLQTEMETQMRVYLGLS